MDQESLHSFALLTHVEKLIASHLEKHELEKKPVIDEMNQRLDRLEKLIVAGFPHGDPDSHRRVHERYIEEAQDRDQMIKGAKQKVFEATLWGALIILATALWDYVKAHLK